MEFLEKDLEQIIWESDNELLQEKDLFIDGKKFRQLRIGNYGIADIVTIDKCYDYCHYQEKNIPYLNITVFELKKEKVGISAFLQSLKYCKGIKTYLEDKKPRLKFKLNISLISKTVDTTGDFIFLTDLVNYDESDYGVIKAIDFYSFKYDINGIFFKREYGYNLVNKGF